VVVVVEQQSPHLLEALVDLVGVEDHFRDQVRQEAPVLVILFQETLMIQFPQMVGEMMVVQEHIQLVDMDMEVVEEVLAP
jgi:hypothetical protein